MQRAWPVDTALSTHALQAIADAKSTEDSRDLSETELSGTWILQGSSLLGLVWFFG